MRTLEEQSDGRRLRLAVLGGLGAVALLGAVFLSDALSFETLARHQARLAAVREAHPVLVALAFGLAYAAIVALSLPGATAATLAGGYLFGVFPGVVYNVLAATLGATLVFLAARWGAGGRLAARIDASDGQVARIKRGIDANQWEMLFLIRLIPAVPFFVANVLPALLDVPLHRYVLTTLLGIVPGALVFTGVGAGLEGVIASGEAPGLGVLLRPGVLWPLAGLIALALLPIAVRAVRGRGR